MTTDWARPMVHWEIQARDPRKIRDFYSQMFNWEIPADGFMAIPQGIGAPEEITGHIIPGETSGVSLYIQVLELRASMAKAASLGGAVLSQPFDVPNGPTVAAISDPEGNRVVLIQQ